MWKLAVAVLIWAAPPPPTAPYVSCPGGYIVKTYADCPPIPHHNNPQNPPVGGGGHGLLGLGIGGIL